MTKIKKIRFREEKLNNLELTKVSEKFSTSLDNKKPVAYPSRVHVRYDSFFGIKISLLLHLSSLRDNYFQKNYRLAEEK